MGVDSTRGAQAGGSRERRAGGGAAEARRSLVLCSVWGSASPFLPVIIIYRTYNGMSDYPSGITVGKWSDLIGREMVGAGKLVGAGRRREIKRVFQVAGERVSDRKLSQHNIIVFSIVCLIGNFPPLSSNESAETPDWVVRSNGLHYYTLQTVYFDQGTRNF